MESQPQNPEFRTTCNPENLGVRLQNINDFQI